MQNRPETPDSGQVSEELPGQPAPVTEQEPEQGFIRELSQFFIIPSLIVLLSVGVFIMFGLIASDEKGAREFLQEVRVGTGNDRWLAAFELSRLLSREPAAAQEPGLVQEIVDLARQAGPTDPRIRKYLVVALEQIGDPAGVPVIIEGLSDADPEVRLHAARAIASFGKVGGSREALAALLSDEDAAIRKVAIYALGQTGDPEAIPILIPRLEDPLEDVRWNAALALAVLGDDAGEGVIATMLDRDHLDSIVGITEEQKTSAVINGVQGAYLLRNAAMLGKLKELRRSDPSLKVREVALKAVAGIETR